MLYLVIFFAFIFLGVGTFPASGSSNSSTFLKGSAPYGMSYEDWMAKWWQWNIQIPKDQHPETLGSDLKVCPVGEAGNVSFLTHSLQGQTEYSCTVPAKHAIMVPILTGECTSDEAQSSVLAEMMKCATEGNKYSTFDVTVDGVRLTGLDQNDARSGIFKITVPDDNFADLRPGEWDAVTGGYFAFLQPLPVGNHSLGVSATVLNPIDPSYNLNYDTEYLLKVQ